MLNGPRNIIAIILTAAVLASCVTPPPPADGIAYTPREQARNQRIQANNDAVVGTAVLAGVAGLAIGAAVASNHNDRYYHNSYYNRGYYGSPYRHHYRRCYGCY